MKDILYLDILIVDVQHQFQPEISAVPRERGRKLAGVSWKK